MNSIIVPENFEVTSKKSQVNTTMTDSTTTRLISGMEETKTDVTEARSTLSLEINAEDMEIQEVDSQKREPYTEEAVDTATKLQNQEECKKDVQRKVDGDISASSSKKMEPHGS